MAVWVIARLTFHEAYRRWVVWVALLLGFLFLGVYAIGLSQIQKDILRSSSRMNALTVQEMYSFFLMAGLYVVNFLTIVMTVLTSIDTLSGEIASGTVQTLVAKPLRRWQVVVGKWLGFAVMLTVYLAFMGGGVLVVVKGLTGYSPPNLWQGMSLMWLNIQVLLSVSLAGGAAFSTLTNGVFVFGLYGVAFIGGWVEQFGAFMRNQAAVNVGVVCSLIIPVEALWKRAAFEMQSPLVAALGFSPFASTSVPSPLMVFYAAGYALLIFALAVHRFNKRDL